MKRINSVDFVRGLVMVIMALDHTRDMFHIASQGQDPANLATTTPILFFTRWITHLCAPTFVFLSGVSAYLSGRNSSVKENRNFLLSRGIWLVLLEFTIITFALWFDLKFRTLFFQVIAAIGFSFIILALLIKLPNRVILAIGLVIIFGHNLLALLPFNTPPYSYFAPLFSFAFFQITPTNAFVIGYPPIPWLGIMLLGYGLGDIFTSAPEKRKSVFLTLGLSALALFVVIRFINIYGDPIPWSAQKNTMYTFLSFMNVTKYPPSLLYTLATLGVSFIILRLVDGAQNKFISFFSVYGKVPLFYYLLHWYILHSLMFLLLFAQGFTTKDFVFGIFQLGRPLTPNGFELPVVYLIWLVVVLSLYPLCVWYSRYKAAHRENRLLRYL